MKISEWKWIGILLVSSVFLLSSAHGVASEDDLGLDTDDSPWATCTYNSSAEAGGADGASASMENTHSAYKSSRYAWATGTGWASASAGSASCYAG